VTRARKTLAVWAPVNGDEFLNSLPLDDNKKTVIKAIANYELPARLAAWRPRHA
jgi:hypothetical protein